MVFARLLQRSCPTQLKRLYQSGPTIFYLGKEGWESCFSNALNNCKFYPAAYNWHEMKTTPLATCLAITLSILASHFDALGTSAEGLRIDNLSRNGDVDLVGTFATGVATIFASTNVAGPWLPYTNSFTTNETVTLRLGTPASNTFYRALAVELSSGRPGFTNLIYSYDLLTTFAGAGGPGDNSNKWRPEFEGGYATNALLSGPHIALADTNGNVFIADKDSHGIRKVLPNGIIVTVAGINSAGNGPDDLTIGTNVAIANPNGLWVRKDGVVYIMDLDNAKIRVLETNGMMRTLFTVPEGIQFGRGLWVNDEETMAYISSQTTVKKWTVEGGVTNYSTGFTELANLVIDLEGNLVVTDRGTHSVWRIYEDGLRERIAGNGFTFNTTDGGDGGLATATGLEGVRGIWFLPTGGFFLCTHRGSQVWYVDTGGFIHLFLNGHRSETHAGDNTWFYNPGEFRVSECRAVTMDHEGNLLVTEHDSGYIRKVKFLRHID